MEEQKQETVEVKKPEIVAAPKKRNPIFLLVLLALISGGAWYGYKVYQYGKIHQETDDAQIEANISSVIPRIGGYVKEIKVKDNQLVKKGDTLLVIDDRDLILKVQQAEASLGTAKSNLGSAQATTNASKATIASTQSGVNIIDAQIETAKVALNRATQDYNRYENLIKDHSITLQQFEQVQAAKLTAEKQLQVLQQQKNQVSVQTNTVSQQSNATSSQVGIANSVIKQREVDVEEAKLNLSYRVVLAQESGILSKVNVQAGQFVQAGQSLFSIVLSNDKWIVANFKETQVAKMKLGQKVTVHIDAFPNDNFEAILTSFSAATGSKFSLLPPDNSSGNFVKVVQRLPLKIEFVNKNDTKLNQLIPGMNVKVDVHTDSTN